MPEHPEDLHDALEVEFQQAYNSEKKHKTRITWEERGPLIRHPTMFEDTWKGLLEAEKGILELNRRHKALTYGTNRDECE